MVCGRGLFIHVGKILPDLLRSTVDAALRDERTKLPPPAKTPCEDRQKGL